MEELEQVQNELNSALEQAEQNLAGWKRAQADLDNYRKRTAAEQEHWLDLGKAMALQKLIPVLDSLEQAAAHAPDIQDEKFQKWRAGLNGILKQLDASLADSGVRKIEAIGKKFDPNLHEAVRQVDGAEDDMVAEQYQTGYTLNGKLIRPAQVAITKKNI
jgi:molecular chaperone GrpE